MHDKFVSNPQIAKASLSSHGEEIDIRPLGDIPVIFICYILFRRYASSSVGWGALNLDEFFGQRRGCKFWWLTGTFGERAIFGLVNNNEKKLLKAGQKYPPKKSAACGARLLDPFGSEVALFTSLQVTEPFSPQRRHFEQKFSRTSTAFV